MKRGSLHRTCQLALAAVAAAVCLWMLLAGHATTSLPRRVRAESSPDVSARRTTMLYTVNNLGYTDTCG